MPQLDVNYILRQCLAGRRNKSGKNINFSEEDLRALIYKAKGIFMKQDTLIQLRPPVNVCGDLHGQYDDLIRVFEYTKFPPDANYLFLGDYVDRGKQNIEVVTLLFAYKIKYPENLFLLRGNHESSALSRVYGFYDECKRRYSVKLWKAYMDCFNCLPLTAVIDDRIMCMHGGISQYITDLEKIRTLPRPMDVPDSGPACDLLWADPGPQPGWTTSDRGVSYLFGEDVLLEFLRTFDLDLIARAHQVVPDGYEFFARRKCVTLFSAPNYCGEFDNAAAVMSVAEDLRCKFHVLRPA